MLFVNMEAAGAVIQVPVFFGAAVQIILRVPLRRCSLFRLSAKSLLVGRIVKRLISIEKNRSVPGLCHARIIKVQNTLLSRSVGVQDIKSGIARYLVLYDTGGAAAGIGIRLLFRRFIIAAPFFRTCFDRNAHRLQINIPDQGSASGKKYHCRHQNDDSALKHLHSGYLSLPSDELKPFISGVPAVPLILDGHGRFPIALVPVSKRSLHDLKHYQKHEDQYKADDSVP